MSYVRIHGAAMAGTTSAQYGPLALIGNHISGHDLGTDAVPDVEIDAEGLIAAAGYIDCQVNGGFGIDLTSEPGALWRLGERLPRHGVTSFLPTLISGPDGVADRAIEALRHRPAGYSGAEPLGLHLEGPMLNPSRRGAHPSASLRRPSEDLIASWSRSAGVAMVTLAPELPDALDIIRRLVSRDIVVAAGHTEADAADAIKAISAGVTAVTHVFNAMAPLRHRRPSLVAAALTSPSLTVSLIVDGIHVASEVVELVWKTKGPDGLMLVTDATAAAGAGHGEFRLGQIRIRADGTTARQCDGRLAGTALTMAQAVRNVVAFTSATTPQALRCASATPARLLGITDRGALGPGQVADIVLLDEQLNVAATICRGNVAFVAEDEQWRLGCPHMDSG